jgi:hypothetical protein
MKSTTVLINWTLVSMAMCVRFAAAQDVDQVASNPLTNQVASVELSGSLAASALPEIGELGVKLDTSVIVVATTIEGPFAGFDGGPNIRIKKINGDATQQMIQMPIRTRAGGSGWEQFERGGKALIEEGKTYELRGYESGSYVETSEEDTIDQPRSPIMLSSASKNVLAESDSASSPLPFRNEFVVLHAKEVSPIAWAPSDFVGREALIAGIAKNVGNVAVIEGPDWKLALEPKPWEPWQIGKQAEAFCKIKESKLPHTFVAIDCRKRLIELQDQIGRKVSLRGTAHALNNHWWFNYRGTDLYFDNLDPQSSEWPTLENSQTIEVSGVLEMTVLPPAARFYRGYKDDRETVFILRGTTWRPTTLTEMETPRKF